MRNIIINRIKEGLLKHDEILSFFEAGSAAFKRNDEYSDLDFGIVVKDDFVDETIEILHSIMNSISPIEEKYILPQPTWHGHWQGFYHLKDTSPYFLLDVLIIKESSPDNLSDVEEHGVPIIYFDKTGRIGTEHTDYTKLREPMQKRIESIKFISGMLYNFVEKEIKRGRLIDAIDFYNNMFLRSLVTLLRMKYDPVRFSWGNRYLSHVLPENIYKELLDLFYVKDEADLECKQKKVLEKIKILLAEDLVSNIPSKA
jgi:predicted nucleotidyltransferase